MNPYDEDVAWQRLIDVQREMENSRIWAINTQNLLRWVGLQIVRAWSACGPAIQRRSRRRAHEVGVEGGEAASRSDAA